MSLYSSTSAYLEKFKHSCRAADLSPLSSFGLTFNSRLFNPVSCLQDSPVRGKHHYPVHQHCMLSATHKFIPRTLSSNSPLWAGTPREGLDIPSLCKYLAEEVNTSFPSFSTPQFSHMAILELPSAGPRAEKCPQLPHSAHHVQY